MKYIEYQFTISPVEPWRDILVAYLGELPFESFEETENGLLAYVQTAKDKEENVKTLPILHSEEVKIEYIRKNSPDINWNEEWEKNFTPINVENQIYIHADFHPERTEIPNQILIIPKMSFGTGHHQTTYNMLHAMLSMNFEKKDVLDMGCGTAVLAIFAKQKGANYVEAIDIDEWSYENSLENAKRNHVMIQVKLGDASVLNGTSFDIILANINKNILLQDINKYVSNLNDNGQLLMSGIYEHDFEDIQKKCEKYNLKFKQKWTKDEWISVLFEK